MALIFIESIKLDISEKRRWASENKLEEKSKFSITNSQQKQIIMGHQQLKYMNNYKFSHKFFI